MKITKSQFDLMIKESILAHIRRSGYNPSKQEMENLFEGWLGNLTSAIGSGLSAAKEKMGHNSRVDKINQAKSELISMSGKVAQMIKDLEDLNLPGKALAGLDRGFNGLTVAMAEMDSEKIAGLGRKDTEALPTPEGGIPEPRGSSSFSFPGGGSSGRGIREQRVQESIRKLVRTSVQEQLKKSRR